MAHLLRSILYPSEGHPNHLTTPPSKVSSFSASNHGRPKRCEGAKASTREDEPVLQGFRARYNNPKVIFTQDPEIEEPAASRFVGDSILGGFDLNQQYEDNCDVDATVNENVEFVLEPYEVLLLCRGQKVLRLFRGQKVLQVGMLLKKQLMGYLRSQLFLMLACWSIEAQSQKFYTPEVFERFQKMISTSTRFHPIQVEVEKLSFDLIPNIGLDIKTYRVEVVAAESLYSCGCNSFEMCGLLCAHIIRVMVHLNVQEIPARYLLHRWSTAATTTPPDPGANTIRFGVPTTNTLKYNALCRKMNNLPSDACYAEDTYAIVPSMVDESSKIVNNMRRA
ncbi:hypothetical protein QYE76_018028 [Lolium multiflorum]|uniref:Protein FAR1-RELATED SEQUENCE n=1 Tax=Lolium multiflorum TaxID=4521 RepID=A0AAD8VEL0_LOLMU|nr:hypothetical protein QYE76_018028 [Lolium multiflorum]